MPPLCALVVTLLIQYFFTQHAIRTMIISVMLKFIFRKYIRE